MSRSCVRIRLFIASRVRLDTSPAMNSLADSHYMLTIGQLLISSVLLSGKVDKYASEGRPLKNQ